MKVLIILEFFLLVTIAIVEASVKWNKSNYQKSNYKKDTSQPRNVHLGETSAEKERTRVDLGHYHLSLTNFAASPNVFNFADILNSESSVPNCDNVKSMRQNIENKRAASVKGELASAGIPARSVCSNLVEDFSVMSNIMKFAAENNANEIELDNYLEFEDKTVKIGDASSRERRALTCRYNLKQNGNTKVVRNYHVIGGGKAHTFVVAMDREDARSCRIQEVCELEVFTSVISLKKEFVRKRKPSPDQAKLISEILNGYKKFKEKMSNMEGSSRYITENSIEVRRKESQWQLQYFWSMIESLIFGKECEYSSENWQYFAFNGRDIQRSLEREVEDSLDEKSGRGRDVKILRDTCRAIRQTLFERSNMPFVDLNEESRDNLYHVARMQSILMRSKPGNENQSKQLDPVSNYKTRAIRVFECSLEPDLGQFILESNQPWANQNCKIFLANNLDKRDVFVFVKMLEYDKKEADTRLKNLVVMDKIELEESGQIVSKTASVLRFFDSAIADGTFERALSKFKQKVGDRS